ncbi:hypothetical protein P7K49_006230 [Saguinus oedipus]|uniref:Uncharacterized protein n=1 Tax=Saguinus oedipus TaxID=9490 RepID=A0ABQ9W1U9_SAGOE|nr:hypothetical protein P7K49_006230 [Saguinus oedipus]
MGDWMGHVEKEDTLDILTLTKKLTLLGSKEKLAPSGILEKLIPQYFLSEENVAEASSSDLRRLLQSLCCLLVLASAGSRSYFHPLSKELLNYINTLNTMQQAGHNFCKVDMC